MGKVFFPFQLSGRGAWKSAVGWKSIARVFKRNKGYGLCFFHWRLGVKNLHFKVVDTSNTTSSMPWGTKMRWEHSAKSYPANELNTRGNIPKRFAPYFAHLQFGEAAQQNSPDSSAPGFPGEDDDRRVSSRQAREQLFWFRFSINKKSSESNTSCQSGQQQIPECSGFSLFDKIDKPHPTLTQQRDKTLSKEIKHSVLSHLWGETRAGQGCAEPAPGAALARGLSLSLSPLRARSTELPTVATLASVPCGESWWIGLFISVS